MKNYQVFTVSGACVDVRAHEVFFDEMYEVYRFLVGKEREDMFEVVAEFNKSQIEGWVEQ